MKRLIKWLSFLFLLSCCTPNTKNNVEQKTGALETKMIRGGRIWSMDWSPDGKFIACGNAAGLLRIYDANTMNLVKVLTGFKYTINGIDWSPNSKKIVASGSSDDPRVIIWDLETESQIIINVHQGQVRSVQWSPKGTYFASSSHDGTIRIWTSDGKFIKKFEGADFGCVGIDWLNEDTLAASCWDNTIRTYNLSGNDELVIENGNHRAKAVLSVDWHPNGKILATGDYGNENDPEHLVKLWSDQGHLIRTMNAHQKEIRDLSWNKKGDMLASGGETIRLWDKEGKLLKVFTRNTSPVWSLDWNPEGTRIASGHNDGKVRIWNTNGELVNSIDGHSAEINVYSFNKDSTALIIGFSDGELRLYNFKDFTSHTIKAHKRGINHISWSHSQSHVAISSNDETGSIWKVSNNKLSNYSKIIAQQGITNPIQWGPNDTKIATGSLGSEVLVWNIDGSYRNSVSLKGKSIPSTEWINKKLFITKKNRFEIDYPVQVYLKINQQKSELIPLNNNRFALIDSLGNLTRGDKKDFVRLKEKGNGFTIIEPEI